MSAGQPDPTTAATPATGSLTGHRRRLRASGWLIPTLDACGEGAWIAVLDAAFAAASGATPLGPIPFAFAAGASLFWVRHAADRTTTIAGLALLYIGAFAGTGLLGATLSGAASQGAPIALAQGAAVFGALAVFRGSRYVDPADDDLVVGSLLQWGFPLLALPWLYASQLAGPPRGTFATAAFPATLVFAAAGLLALGLARLDSLAALSGVDWRANRAWLVLLLGVLAIMVVIALPTAFLLGTPLTVLAVGLLGPLAVLLSPVATLFGKFVEFIFFLLTPLLDLIRSLVGERGQTQDAGPIGGPGPLVPAIAQQGEPSTLGLAVLAGIAIAIGVVMFLVVLRLTYRPRSSPAAPAEGPLEDREFRLPTPAVRLPRLGLPHRQARPTTATGAYLAFLSDLAALPDLARHPDEPPATHVARLRSAGFADPRAAFLVADYELERYALRSVTASETGRAVRRQIHLRDLLRERLRRPARPMVAPDSRP